MLTSGGSPVTTLERDDLGVLMFIAARRADPVSWLAAQVDDSGVVAHLVVTTGAEVVIKTLFSDDPIGTEVEPLVEGATLGESIDIDRTMSVLVPDDLAQLSAARTQVSRHLVPA